MLSKILKILNWVPTQFSTLEGKSPKGILKKRRNEWTLCSSIADRSRKHWRRTAVQEADGYDFWNAIEFCLSILRIKILYSKWCFMLYINCKNTQGVRLLYDNAPVCCPHQCDCKSRNFGLCLPRTGPPTAQAWFSPQRLFFVFFQTIIWRAG